MSVVEYKYQKVTHEQLVKCLYWCQNQLQLRDWEITLCTGDTPPKDFMGEEDVLKVYGMVKYHADKLKAVIWMDIANHRKRDQNAYATVIHEATHVFLAARGEDTEQVVCVLEPLLYRLYCADNHLKIMEKVKND